MRLIAGKFKGRSIPSARNATYRPSTGKVKEAIFSILTARSDSVLQAFDSMHVLDLCAGTGSFGFESLSRGAAHVTLADCEQRYLEIAESFASQIGAESQMSYIRVDATNLPKSNKLYDLVFIDPPYNQNIAQIAISALHNKNWLNQGCKVVIEFEKREAIEIPKCYREIDCRTYGRTKVMILLYGTDSK